jgi:hypothetical protein
VARVLFDLHIKVSELNAGGFTARVILGNNGILFERTGFTIAEAIRDLVLEMDSQGVYQMLITTPSLSTFSSAPTPVPAAVPTAKPATSPAGTVTGRQKSGGTTPRLPWENISQEKKEKATLERPVDLSAVAYPSCTTVCQSHDIFGAGKCKNMCKSKSGV